MFCGHEDDGISGLNGLYDFDAACDAVIPRSAMRIAHAGGDIVEALKSMQNELTQAKVVVDAALAGHPTVRKRAPVITTKTWTPERVEILKRVLPVEGVAGVQRELPGMTETGIVTKAREEGLMTANKWTEAEDAVIRRYWDVEGTKVYQRLPGRSQAAVYRHAKMLGLKGQKSNALTPKKSSGVTRQASEFVEEDSLLGPITLGKPINHNEKEEN